MSTSKGIWSRQMKIKIQYKFIITSIAIACLNIMTYDNKRLALAVVLAEVLVLVVCLLLKKYGSYFCYYLIFLSLCMEFKELLLGDDLFNFKEVRILGFNLGIIFLIPLLIKGICFWATKINCFYNDYHEMSSFVISFLGVAVSGISMSVVMIFLNDNNICSYPALGRNLINEIYSKVLFPGAMIVSASYIVMSNSENVAKVKHALLSILIGIVAELLVSYSTQRYGFYSIKTLLTSNVVRYIPFMLIVFLYEDYKKDYRLSYLTMAFVGMYFSLKYNATGKLIILYILTPFIAISILYIQNKKKMVCLSFLIPFLAMALVMLFNHLLLSNALFSAKYKQVIRLFSFGADWMNNMPLSPKVRIAEIINIGKEYMQKPYLILLGKGYMGTTVDYTGIYHSARNANAFSNEEYNAGIFYAVHESFSSLWLYNGATGVAIYLKLLKKVMLNASTTPFILIGGFWFLIVYGFSVTMSAFGIAALIIGLYDIDNERLNRR